MNAAAAVAGSQGLWFVSRASGLALLVAFSAVVVLGVAARLGSAPRRWSRLVVAELLPRLEKEIGRQPDISAEQVQDM